MKNITLVFIFVFIISVTSIFVVATDKDADENVAVAHGTSSADANSQTYFAKNEAINKKQSFVENKKKDGTDRVVVKRVNKISQGGIGVGSDKVPADIKHLNSPNIDIALLKKSLSLKVAKSSLSMASVATHSTPSDCYLVINGNVYNVTSYLPYHPAGARIIEDYCGHEVTGLFAQIHSNRAWDLLGRFKIGSINAKKYNIMPNVLSAISQSLNEKNPSAIVMKVSPKNGMYVAKVIFDNKFYEVHINEFGKIIKEEVAENENWDNWEVDVDDR